MTGVTGLTKKRIDDLCTNESLSYLKKMNIYTVHPSLKRRKEYSSKPYFPTETKQSVSGETDMKYYDKEEKELIDWYEEEHDNFKPVAPSEEERLKGIFRKGIAERQRKDARVNFRINSRDLTLFKARALREGVSYQNLISQLIRRYIQSDT